MPWCPKCRNEYREGFTVCADCGVELVDKLGEKEENKSSLLTGPIEELEHLMEFLNASKVKGVSLQDNGDGSADLLIEDKHRKEASFAVKTYFDKRKEEAEDKALEQQRTIHETFSKSDEEDDEDEDYDDDDDEDEEKSKPEKIYHSSKEKADDARSSAIILTITGILGLTFEALVVFHVLPLSINGTPGKVLYGFMALVFLGLIISGIMSVFTAKRLRASIVDESKIRDEILAFCKNEAVDTVNKMIQGGDDSADESVYFARIDFLKSAIKRESKFKDVEDSTIEGLLDENYQELFG